MTVPPPDATPTVDLAAEDRPAEDDRGRHEGPGSGEAPAAVVALPGRPVEILKVSTRSHPTSVAGAIAGVIRARGTAEIQVVGAGALNQAIKAVAVARGFLADAGLDLVCTPSFVEVQIDGEDRTAIRLVVDDRAHRLVEPAFTPPPYAVHS